MILCSISVRWLWILIDFVWPVISWGNCCRTLELSTDELKIGDNFVFFVSELRIDFSLLIEKTILTLPNFDWFTPELENWQFALIYLNVELPLIALEIVNSSMKVESPPIALGIVNLAMNVEIPLRAYETVNSEVFV